MRPGSGPSKLKICIRHAFFPLIIIIICAWMYAVVYVLQNKDSKKVPKRKQSPSQFNIPSYALSASAYRAQLPSIQYSNDHSTVVKQLDLFPMNSLMNAWDFDDTSPNGWLNSPAHPNKGHSIPRFDYGKPEQLATALEYRKKEIPFIVFNVPEVEQAIANTFTIDKLLENFGDKLLDVEKSSSNRFMYYKQPKMMAPDDWEPPQEDITMTFPEYLSLVEKAESNPPINRDRPLYYMSMAAKQGWKTDWVRMSLTIFDKEKPTFFIVDPSGSRGINCRFGMKGVSAAVHYDGGRNFIAMLRGRKRYVILPPEECNKLELYPKAHPSGRHSRLDWSNATELALHEQLYHASATEAIISAGEVLYLPSYWFHYIVSQDGSIQCNSRSGDSEAGREVIANCGFYADKEKKQRKKTLRASASNRGV